MDRHLSSHAFLVNKMVVAVTTDILSPNEKEQRETKLNAWDLMSRPAKTKQNSYMC